MDCTPHTSTEAGEGKGWGLTPQLDNIPRPLKGYTRWNPWFSRPRRGQPGKMDKIPALGASTRTLDRWSTWDRAVQHYERSAYVDFSGIGFCLTGLEGHIFVDLDQCVTWDGDDCRVSPEAWDLVLALDSYTEFSPSSTGLRIILHGELDEFFNHDAGVEVYNGGSPRFVTLTGRVFEGQDEIRDLTPGGERALVSHRTSESMTSRGYQDATERPMPDPGDMPDLSDVYVPEEILEPLREGFRERDRSKALLIASIHLYKAGLDENEVFDVLANSPGAMEIALDHRNGREEKALKFLWDQHVLKAQAHIPEGARVAHVFGDKSQTQGPPRDRRDPDRPRERLRDRLKREREESRPAAEGDNPRGPFMTFGARKAPEHIPPRDWLMKGHLLRRNLSVLVGRGGTAKSTWALLAAISVATGRDLLGLGIEEQTDVVLVNNEDDPLELERRVWGIARKYGIPIEEIDRHLMVYSGYEKPLVLFEADQTSGEVFTTKDHERFIANVIENGAGMIVLDPFVTIHGSPENDNKQMDVVARSLKAMAARTDTAVLVVHHAKKGDQRPGDADLARGATALGDAARIVLTMTRPTPADAEAMGILEYRNRYVQVVVGKENYFPSPADGSWIYLDSVDLGQGDQVGVAEPWSPPAGEASEPDWIAQGVEAMPSDREAAPTLEARLAGLWDLSNTRARNRFTAQLPRGRGNAASVQLSTGWVYRVWIELEDGESLSRATVCKEIDPEAPENAGIFD